MYKPLTEKEIEFLEHFYDTTSLTENLIPENFNAPQTWTETERCIYIRPYQIAMLNYSYMYADDPDLDKKENFRRKKGAGDSYQIGSRDTGKSLILKIDVLLSIIHRILEGCVASFDAKHLRNVTQPVASYTESHSFLQMFHLKDSRKKTVSRDPLTIQTEHGSLIKAVNEKVHGNDPGTGFHALHFETLWYEESSYMSQEGTQKRIDSGSSFGHIERLSGIPDLRIGSPLTRILNDEKKKKWIWRLPQYVKESWDEKTKQEKIEQYGGEHSTGYKLNIEAEIIEGAYGFWDIKRIKSKCLRLDRRIKFFEVHKDHFHKFEHRIIIDKLPGSIQTYICADIGGSASPTEIIIIFYDGEKYKYHYNISLFKLTQKEQAQIFYWLYKKLGGAFISCDSTHDNGVTIDYLYDMGVPQEHLLKVFFNKNIDVDFERDENGNVQYNKNGNPIMRSVNTLDWSMHELEHLIYEGLLEVPIDEKFFKEFNGYIVKQVGTRKIYGSTTTDHLHQAFQVWSICRFFNEFNPMKILKKQKRCWGVFFNDKEKS